MPFKLFLSAFLLMSMASDNTLENVRAHYLKGSTDSKSAESLKTLTSGKTEAIYKAYHGVAWGFMAKHSNNPVNKLDYVKKGLAFLNDAVLADAINVEIRFLRFSVEENIPSIVSFTSHVKGDKAMILTNLTSSHAFYKTMKAYLQQSKSLTEAEKKSIK
ncbi:MAG: hypothetical protein ACKOXF_11295 [Chitinophagaceae bacterium]